MSFPRPPVGLPHAVPDAELHEAGCRWTSTAAPGTAAFGRCQIEGIPLSSRHGRDQPRAGKDRIQGSLTRDHHDRPASPSPTEGHSAPSHVRPGRHRLSTAKSTTASVPSPGGRPRGWGVGACVIPSASRRATARWPGGQSLRISAGGCVEGCPRATARSGAARPRG